MELAPLDTFSRPRTVSLVTRSVSPFGRRELGGGGRGGLSWMLAGRLSAIPASSTWYGETRSRKSFNDLHAAAAARARRWFVIGGAQLIVFKQNASLIAGCRLTGRPAATTESSFENA